VPSTTPVQRITQAAAIHLLRYSSGRLSGSRRRLVRPPRCPFTETNSQNRACRSARTCRHTDIHNSTIRVTQMHYARQRVSSVSSAPAASLATHPYWLVTRRSATMTLMAAPPASTKTSLQQRLSDHARAHWPQLAGVTVRFCGAFAYVEGQLLDGDTLPLMRLRHGGSAARWASRCTWPARTATKMRSCRPAPSLVSPKMPSTAPPASTSVTPRADQPPTD
jgi:hypothetical protein